MSSMNAVTLPSRALPMRMPFLIPGNSFAPVSGPDSESVDVDAVVGGDGDAARPPELPPLVDERAVLIEDLDAVVLAVAHEHPPARVERDRVRLADLAAARPLLAPLLDERAVLGEPDHAVVLAVAVAVGDEDVAARRHHDVGRLIEQIGARAADAGLAQRHQHAAIGVELEHLVALAVGAARIRDP